MTFKVGKTLFICTEAKAKCEGCGRFEELRPYGKNAANVCFDCAMKDEANAAEMFRRRVVGNS